MAAAAFAKLLWLEAKEVRDPDGADEIVVSSGGLQFKRIRMRKDDVFEFDERSIAHRSPSLREKDNEPPRKEDYADHPKGGEPGNPDQTCKAVSVAQERRRTAEAAA